MPTGWQLLAAVQRTNRRISGQCRHSRLFHSRADRTMPSQSSVSLSCRSDSAVTVVCFTLVQVGQCRHSRLFHYRADRTVSSQSSVSLSCRSDNAVTVVCFTLMQIGLCRHSRLFHSRADRTVSSQSSVSLSCRSDSAVTVVCFTLVHIGQCRNSLFPSRADRTTGLCGRTHERQHRLAGAFAAQIPSSGYGNQCRIQSTHSGYFGQGLSQSMYVRCNLKENS